MSDVPRLKHLKDTELVSFRANRAMLENFRALAEKNERTFSQEIRLAMVKHLKAAQAAAA